MDMSESATFGENLLATNEIAKANFIIFAPNLVATGTVEIAQI